MVSYDPLIIRLSRLILGKIRGTWIIIIKIADELHMSTFILHTLYILMSRVPY